MDWCLNRLDGEAPAPAATGNEWTTVYELDFRAAFADLGATDLNSLGSSFTYQGVTWVTPTLANSGLNMVTTATAFGLTAAGLEAEGVVGGSLAGPPYSAAHIFASLNDIGNNTATPFASDPTRAYLIQIYISEFTPSINFDGVAVMLYKLANIPPGSGQGGALALLAQLSGVEDVPQYIVSGGTNQSRPDLPPAVYDVPTIHRVGSPHSIDGYCGQFGAGWPANGDLAFISSWAGDLQVAQFLPGSDPRIAFRIGAAFDGGGGAGMDAVVQRLRISQL